MSIELHAEWQSRRGLLGARHPSTLEALHALTRARHAEGDQQGALRDAADLLVAYTDVLGPGHPNTLSLAATVANWRLVSGEPRAVDELRRLIPVMTEVLGADHENTLWARHTLATADPDDAPEVRLVTWVTLCADEQRVFGTRHVLTLAALFGAAEARAQLGDLLGARTDMLVVLAGRRKVLGDRHPETLSAWLLRANYLGESGDLHLATQQLDELIPLLEDVLGYDHANAMAARYRRAAWSSPKADLVERVSEWEVLAHELHRVHGPGHPLSQAADQALAGERARWQESLHVHQELGMDMAADMRAEQFGEELDDTDLDEISAEVGDECQQLADQMAAMVAAKLAAARAVRENGNDSREALAARYDIGWLLWNGRYVEEARPRVARLADDCLRILGDTDPLTVSAGELSACLRQS